MKILILLMILVFTSTAYAGQLNATWYSTKSLKREGTWKHGERRMANGDRFDENALICATRLWPLDVLLRITNTTNGRSVTCRVSDRIGKRFTNNRIDLSRAAFQRIGSLNSGIIPVQVEEVKHE